MALATLARFGMLLAALPALLLSQKINIEFDDSADFAQYRTFMIRPGQLHSKSPSLNSDLIRKQIDSELRKRLQAKGLAEVFEAPDLNVRYSLGSANRREVEAYPAGWRGLGTRRVAFHYTEGTLVLDLRDAKKRELVWRAIAVEDKSDPMKLQQHLDEMILKPSINIRPRRNNGSAQELVAVPELLIFG